MYPHAEPNYKCRHFPVPLPNLLLLMFLNILQGAPVGSCCKRIFHIHGFNDHVSRLRM
jgi:hypothetical protein